MQVHYLNKNVNQKITVVNIVLTGALLKETVALFNQGCHSN